MTLRAPHRLLGVLLVCVLALSALGRPTEAASPARAKVALVLQRTTTGPSSFHLTLAVGFNAKGGEGLVASVGGQMVAARFQSEIPGYVTSFGRNDNKTASARGNQTSLCNAVGMCFSQSQLDGVFVSGTTYEDSTATGNINTWYAVAEGASARIAAFKAKGWTLKRIPLGYRYVDGADSQLAVHIASVDGLEVFTEPATGRGGAYGSLAVGVPPCSAHTVGLPRGVARLTLSGGETTANLECPGLSSYPAVARSANRQTTWELRGVAVGETALAETRLFVLDLPKPAGRR